MRGDSPGHLSVRPILPRHEKHACPDDPVGINPVSRINVVIGVDILESRKVARYRQGMLIMTQQVQTIIRLNGVANGSGFTSQQPTVVFENLPYGPWTTLSSPRAVNGKVIGYADPSQYKVAIFAVEARGEYTGNNAWLVDIAADGTFAMQVNQAAALYVALLMTPSFATSYFAQTFPTGSGTTHQLPTPADNPGDVLLMLELPAGLNRSIVIANMLNIPELAPGQDWVNTQGYGGPTRALVPQNNNNAPNPDQMTPQSTQNLWQMMLGGSSATLCVVAQPKNPDGNLGAGAFAAGVYVYMNTMYLVAGAGPRGGGSTTPIIVTSPLVEWAMFAPSLVQLNMNLTILPERAMVSIDVMEVEPSLIYTFLKLLYEVEKKMMELMFAEI